MLRHIFLLFSAAAALCASAAVVDCTPGKVESLIGTSGLSDTSLRLTGSIDATDLLFIGSKMTSLATLDLSDVTIVASNGTHGKYAAGAIPAGAFAGSDITSLSLPEGVFVGDCAFAGTKISTLVLPSKTTIGVGAFSGCGSLTSLVLGSGSTISGHAFASCTALKTADLGGNTSVGEYSFAGCTTLATVTGAQNLTAVAADAFNGCADLAAFPFAASIKTIADGAFRHSGLESASLENTSVSSIGQWAFADCAALSSVSLPASCTTLGQGVFFDCPLLEQVNIPAGCKEIPAYAFKDDSSLGELELADSSLSKIGAYSLKGIGTSKLSLPVTLDSIGNNAMEDAAALTHIDATKLEAVPALGSDVWAGVEQSAATVDVNKNIAELFEAAPQWQDFNINPVEVNTVISTPSCSETSVRGAFTADRLMIESTEVVTEVSVYDVSGMLLYHCDTDSCQLVIPAEAFGNIIIVNCRLVDGLTATLKLAR